MGAGVGSGPKVQKEEMTHRQGHIPAFGGHCPVGGREQKGQTLRRIRGCFSLCQAPGPGAVTARKPRGRVDRAWGVDPSPGRERVSESVGKGSVAP